MRDFTAEHIATLPPSGIRKFFDVVATMENVISLGVGEPDFQTPKRVREAAIQSLAEGKTRYSSNWGMPKLREHIAHYLERRFGLVYDTDQILCTIGASEAIDVTLRTVLEIGDEVLIPEPSYVAYKPAVALQHGVPVVVQTKAECDFRLQAEDLEKAITEKTKVLILPYPNNPTGAILEQKELQEIAKVCIKHDLLVISDEIYAELTYGGKNHVSIASMEGMAERTVVLNGFAKSFSMTGWRLGYAAGPKALMKQINKVHAYIIMCAPTMSQYGAIEALQDDMLCDADVDNMRKAYDARRQYLVKTLDGLGLTCFEPEGAFYVFPSIAKTGLTAQAFCEKLLFEAGVAVIPGDAFGESGENHVRISYAYSMEQLQTAMEKIKVFLEQNGWA